MANSHIVFGNDITTLDICWGHSGMSKKLATSPLIFNEYLV
jgi:hypothetical protein